MLILVRRKGEAVDLSDKRTGEVLATITVLEVTPGGIRLGFDALPGIRIMRDNAIRRDDGQGNDDDDGRDNKYEREDYDAGEPNGNR